LARRGRVLIGAAASTLAHGLILVALFAARPERIETAAPPVIVALVPLERLRAPAADKPASGPAAARPPRRVVRKPPPQVRTLPVLAASGAVSDEMGEAELAGAAGAGGGGGGGGCDMVRRLQDALRRDPQVLAALAKLEPGKALRIWNGAWVPHPGQEGAGLAAVREAISWEVGFAPDACKHQRVQGLVLISLADRPGPARIVVGAADWRWSDLLFSR
jgi:hypothetical protein